MATENEMALNNGFLMAKAIMLQAVKQKLVEFSETMLHDAYDLRGKEGWSSWSGNTETSYTCGVALNGSMVYMKSVGDNAPAPLIPKLKKGQTRTLKVDYSGRTNQRRTGKVNITDPYGTETAKKTVGEVKSKSNTGLAFRMATGTEYSQWLEFKKGWKVLGGSFAVAEERLKAIMSRK
jgi:hypothetical protein